MSHLWGEWRLQTYWPREEQPERPAIRSWLRECGRCSSSEYRRHEDGGYPDNADEVIGLLFPSVDACLEDLPARDPEGNA